MAIQRTPPRLPVAKFYIRQPHKAEANPCLGVMSSVLGELRRELFGFSLSLTKRTIDNNNVTAHTIVVCSPKTNFFYRVLGICRSHGSELSSARRTATDVYG